MPTVLPRHASVPPRQDHGDAALSAATCSGSASARRKRRAPELLVIARRCHKRKKVIFWQLRRVRNAKFHEQLWRTRATRDAAAQPAEAEAAEEPGRASASPPRCPRAVTHGKPACRSPRRPQFSRTEATPLRHERQGASSAAAVPAVVSASETRLPPNPRVARRRPSPQ